MGHIMCKSIVLLFIIGIFIQINTSEKKSECVGFRIAYYLTSDLGLRLDVEKKSVEYMRTLLRMPIAEDDIFLSIYEWNGDNDIRKKFESLENMHCLPLSLF